MTDLMYSSMSLICPRSSCRDTKRKIKGSRMCSESASGSGRLVTHMSRFESQIPNLRICITSCVSISSFMRLRTFARGGGTTDVFGHAKGVYNRIRWVGEF